MANATISTGARALPGGLGGQQELGGDFAGEGVVPVADQTKKPSRRITAIIEQVPVIFPMIKEVG